MQANLFERKEFLNQGWMHQNSSELFTNSVNSNRNIVKINLLRATANEAEAFRAYLSELETKSENNIIIDLGECEFIDSTFLSTILSFNRKSSLEIELVVKNIKQLTIFKITRLHKIFNIYDSLEVAMAS